MKAAIAGKLPVVEPGPNCDEPYECPFKARCVPEVGVDHVSTLYLGRRIAETLLGVGIESIHAIPEDTKLSAIQARQVRSVKTGKVVVDDGLADALATIEAPIAFLDFETINPAVPVWKGCGPFMQVPVQMSCHVVGARRATAHHEHLADGPDDPRPAMAEAVVSACGDAKTVVAYNASFEKRCIEHLAEHVPSQRAALKAVAKKLVDLLPIVRNHVYHPDFGGGFSMKVVAPALAGLDYSELEIGEGGTASAVLEGLLLGGTEIKPAEQKKLRKQLLEYCKQDTLAMVKVVERLRKLA
jgi:predicted RecB family nuclease